MAPDAREYTQKQGFYYNPSFVMDSNLPCTRCARGGMTQFYGRSAETVCRQVFFLLTLETIVFMEKTHKTSGCREHKISQIKIWIT